MTPARTPWLFLKRLNAWSPLHGVREMLAPSRPEVLRLARGRFPPASAGKERKAWRLRARWILTD